MRIFNRISVIAILMALPLIGFAQKSVKIIFAGDVMCHSPQLRAAKQNADNYDFTPCFRFVKDYIQSADIAIANLETTLGGAPYTTYPCFSSPDALAVAVKDAGFDILTTNNNHCYDKGKQGLERTIRVLDSLGIAHLGTYTNSKEHDDNYPMIVEKNGIRIALLSYTYGTNGIPVSPSNVVNTIDSVQMLADLQKARKQKPDYIITIMHWGDENYVGAHNQQAQYARMLMRNGCDIVIGSHPHVVQNVTVDVNPYNFRFPEIVVYSMGNLISNQRKAECEGGIMIELEIEKIPSMFKEVEGTTTLTRCDYMPYWVHRGTYKGLYQYYLVPTADAIAYPESYEIKPDMLARLKAFHERITQRIANSLKEDATPIKAFKAQGKWFNERQFYRNQKLIAPPKKQSSNTKAKKQPQRYTYNNFTREHTGTDKVPIFVFSADDVLLISQPKAEGKLIPGFADQTTYVDLENSQIYYQYTYEDDSSYYIANPYVARNDIKWDTIAEGDARLRFVTSINSNRIEIVVDTASGNHATATPGYGYLPGVMLEMWRNGQKQIELAKIEPCNDPFLQRPISLGRKVSYQEMDRIKKSRMILTKRVFDDVQLYWGANTDYSGAEWYSHNPNKVYNSFPYDTAIHFAGGTVVLKRMHFDSIPAHYQLFAELHQRSNGDAYDRTGSVFIIPQKSLDNVLSGKNQLANREQTFLEAMYLSPDSLPITVGKDGQRYHGIVAGENYKPIVELIRFFTPFGVNHFNGRVAVEGVEWADEAYYKQDITDLASMLQGDVWIGAFIGNYDGGGHKITLDIKAYPQSDIWDEQYPSQTVLPLFNTCNVLEMAGQNYGKIFGSDKLTVEFIVPKDAKNMKLRYISTGHGGWGGGDEFNPKENSIYIDGKKRFSHTPWRCDCGTYRSLNPVSGIFWNGVTSSDYSRSGWCPGTATQPVYFDLTGLKPGKHTITIDIPQGLPVDGGFSHWNISGALIIE